MRQEMQIYLNGEWEKGEGRRREILNPATEEQITTVLEASKNQVEKAAIAAEQAFKKSEWATNNSLRVSVLQNVAKLLETESAEMAKLETENTGKPIREAILDIQDSVSCLRYYASLIDQQQVWQKEMYDGTTSEVHKEPIGVCSLIVPWNFPLLLGIWKIAPALAAGNTILFKPSELTPLSAIKFTELLEKTPIPPGVFNLLLGGGDPVGKEMVKNEHINKVSFTGGSETGRWINQECATSFKRVSLELGGKSPMIILEDADIPLATEWAIFGSFFNQGEVCVASSRLLVHEDVYEPFITELVGKLKNLTIGDPSKEETEFGPVISNNHLKKIMYYIQLAKEEGATCLYGGDLMNTKGFYLTPAVFTDVKQDMRMVQEEVFGPVITIQTFCSDSEAVELANGTKYGLAAGILTKNLKRADRLAGQIKAGTIWINSYHTPYVEAPWGGFKQSGIGRELGPQGLDGFMEIKHVNKKGQLEQLNWYQF